MGAACLQFVFPLQAPANPLDDDELETPGDNPIISSLTFLPWGAPSAAGTVRVPRAILQAVFLPACKSDPTSAADKAALSAANILEHELSAAKTSELAYAFYRAGLFDAQFHDVGNLGNGMLRCLGRLPDPSVLYIRGADIQASEPFDSAGAAPAAGRGRGRGRGRGAQPAAPQPVFQAGPADLLPLRSVTWLSLLQEKRPNSDLEGQCLAFLYGYLGSKARFATRDDPNSELRTATDGLVSYVLAWSKIPTARPAVIARKIPPFLNATSLALPLPLLGRGGGVADYSCDLQDSFTIISGNKSEIEHIYARRIFDNLSSFPALVLFAPLVPAVGQMSSAFDQLSVKLLGSRRVSPYSAAVELDAHLQARLPLLQQLVGTDGATLESVVQALLDLHKVQTAVSAGGDAAAGGPTALAGAARASSGGGILSEQIQVALSSAAFLQAVDAVNEATGIDRLDAAFCSQSILLIRYVVDAPGWLRIKHSVFDELAGLLDDRQAYFSRVVAFDTAAGEVPDSVASWRWDRTTCDTKFLTGLWHNIDWVNSPTGYLDFESVAKVTTYHPVRAEEIYITQQTLLGVKWFGGRLFGALGFPSQCDHGHSFGDFIDHHMMITQYITTMPNELRGDWDSWATTQFEGAMRRAGRHWIDTIRSGTPASASLSGWLPSDAEYFQVTAARMTAAKPILDVRRAFGSSAYFTTTPLVVPGATPPQGYAAPGVINRLGGGAAAGGGAVAGASADAGIDPKAGGKRKAAAAFNEPGAKSSLATLIEGGKSLYLAGMVYDLDAICRKWGLKKADHCWPVLLSSKPGAQALSLCPDHTNHGGIKSACHKCPPQFNRATASAAPYAKKATPAQSKEAGCGSGKSSKI